jgi:hypothetical protein
MAKTLLTGVNEVLKKVQIVNSNNELTSLTQSAKQIFIDNAVSAWGEAVDQIYSKAKINQPNQSEEETITLVEDQREYDLPCDLVQLNWPLHNETEGRYINKYPGGYTELRNALVQPANYTGQPTSGAISPVDGTLYIDMLPSASEAGDIYRFTYWKDLTITKATDQFPFSDTVFRALVPVVAEVWKFYQHNKYTDGIVKVNYGRAVRALKQEPRDASWITRPGSTYVTNPLGKDPYAY